MVLEEWIHGEDDTILEPMFRFAAVAVYRSSKHHSIYACKVSTTHRPSHGPHAILTHWEEEHMEDGKEIRNEFSSSSEGILGRKVVKMLHNVHSKPPSLQFF